MRFKNRNESGRTMLEMIGVISVIGVLTVLPLMSIRQASIQANVNNVLIEVRKRAVVMGGARRNSSHPLVTGLFDKKSGSAPVVISSHAIGDGGQDNTFRPYEGSVTHNGVRYNVAFVPIGKHTREGGEYGSPISVKFCKELIKKIPAKNVTPVVGDVLQVKNSAGTNLTMSKCKTANMTDVVWLGIRTH